MSVKSKPTEPQKTPSEQAQPEKMSGVARKADLIEAALQVFSEKGYDRASLQDIAERVGILKGSVYYYFQSKEQLLFGVVRFVHDQFLDNARTLAAKSGDPLTRLRNLLIGHAIFICDNIDRAVVFLREMDALPPEQQARILGPDHAYQRVFRDLIIAGQSQGQIPEDVNPKLATLWILGALNWLHRWYRSDRPEGPESVATQFAEQLTRGVASSMLWSAQFPS